MKKIMTLAAALSIFVALSASAQINQKIYPADSPYYWKNNRHEVSISVGYLPDDEDTVYEMDGYAEPSGNGYYYYYGYYYGYYNGNGSSPTIDQIIENSKYYLSEVRQSWAFNANYYYNVLKWFQVGATASYHQVTRNKFSTSSRERVGNYDRNFFSIVPSVKFIYFRRPAVMMYSGIGLGYGGVYLEDEQTEESRYADYLASNLTFFGISAGKRLFGTAEVGCYTTGYLRFGVGYRF